MKRTLRQIYTPGTLLDGAMAVGQAQEAGQLPAAAYPHHMLGTAKPRASSCYWF